MPATLILIILAGCQELRLSHEGRDSARTLVLNGSTNRLEVRVAGRRLLIEPRAYDEPTPAPDWADIHRAVHEDALLADLVGDLYGKPGFGGSLECLQALLELGPLIHSHEEVARRLVREAPDRLHDPMAEIVLPLRAALRAAEK